MIPSCCELIRMDSPAIMVAVSKWVLYATYNIWHQHFCCDYNEWFLSHHGDSQRVSPLYHLRHMTPAFLFWLHQVIPQPSMRQSSSESSVPFTTYDTSISVSISIRIDSPAIMATVSEWVLCTTYHIWRQHLCHDYNKPFPIHHGDSRRVSPRYRCTAGLTEEWDQSPEQSIKGTWIKTLSSLRRLRQGPSYSTILIVSHSATPKEWSVQSFRRAKYKTYSPFVDRWVILTTSKVFHYFQVRQDVICFAFGPP